jgi:hypothetical protein
VYDIVWRHNFGAPGFCLIDLGLGVKSHVLRELMVELRRELSRIHLERNGPPTFAVRIYSRFDQKASTGFHLDGAAPAALLMLGYEPSIIHSRIFIADYTRCAFELGISAQAFLNEPLPGLPQPHQILSSYVTELPQPEHGHSRLLLINNSATSFRERAAYPLGVLHRAEVTAHSTSGQRVINSVMIVLGKPDLNCAEQEDEFVNSDTYNPYVE